MVRRVVGRVLLGSVVAGGFAYVVRELRAERAQAASLGDQLSRLLVENTKLAIKVRWLREQKEAAERDAWTLAAWMNESGCLPASGTAAEKVLRNVEVGVGRPP